MFKWEGNFFERLEKHEKWDGGDVPLPGLKKNDTIYEINGKTIVIENGGARGDSPYPPDCSWEPEKILGYFYWKRDTQYSGNGLETLRSYLKDPINKNNPWHSAVAVISVLPLEQIIEIGPDNIQPLLAVPDSAREKNKNTVTGKSIEKAFDRLGLVLPSAIKERAGLLKYTKTDDIINWGKGIQEILSDFITQSARDTRAVDMKTGESSEQALKNFADLLEIKEVGKIRRTLIQTRLVLTNFPVHVGWQSDKKLRQKIAPWDQKMNRNLDAMSELERQYSADIERAQRRIELTFPL